MIRTAVYGFGNLGRAVCRAIETAPDMFLTGIYSRRAAALRLSLQEDFSAELFREPETLDRSAGKTDIIINCGGSARDLPRTTACLARTHCVVDSYDNHPLLPEHFAAVDTAALYGSTLCIIGAGWDPGLFSLQRLLGAAFFPESAVSTFWGPGVSQGHSDALRKITGVLDARQYTVPLTESMECSRKGSTGLTGANGHRRICYIAADPAADKSAIEKAVRTMPNYFEGYDTEIHFVTPEALQTEHSRLPHGGCVICASPAEKNLRHSLEFQLTSEDNPSLTAGILVACARAAVKLHRSGAYGCRTMADIPPALYLPQDGDTIRSQWL